MDRNQHVKDCLTYYIAFPHPPHFAVMLNGPWGIGKTYLLKEFLKPIAANGLKFVYVSLNGLTSLDEIDDALFRAMYPLLEHKGVKMAGRAVKVLGKYFSIDIDNLRANDLLNKANADLFVFDDLERCDIPVNRMLGYINEFVEHEDRKVIIISNENEIKESDDYARIREKLIGKTLEIQSAFEQALHAFLESVQNEKARSFLTSKTNELSTIYHQSELHNLRILQQTIWDFERFYSAINDKHRNNDRAMTALLGLLFSFSFELKAGRLKSDDLLGRQYALVTSMMRSRREESPPSPFAAAQHRYPAARLDDTALSDETLIDLLVKGIVNEKQIRAELDASSFFVSVAEEPAWRTVWHAIERTEDEFNTALAKMEQMFAAREFVEPGEILHVLGLRLWLSDIGVIAVSRPEAVEEGKRYIDDLYSNGKLKPSSPHDDSTEMRFSGYGGLGIHETETPEYRELYRYLKEQRLAAEADQHPEIANELLSNLETDPELFGRRVTFINGEANELYRTPVVAAIDPEKFVTALLGLHPARQHNVLLALKARYEHGHLDGALAAERPWASEVREKLLAAGDAMSLLGKYRTRQYLKYTLDGVLENKD